ncbi:MAG: L,D-transpeptidase [Solirubrobacteraceae bacterium]
MLVVVAAVLIVGASREDRVADGVRVAGLNVGGVDADAARERVRRELDATVRRPVEATYRSRRFVLRPDLADVHVDADATVAAALERERAGSVTPRISYSRADIEDFAARVSRRLDIRARDADIEVRDGKLDRTRARNGVEVKRREFVDALVRAMARQPGSGRAVKVPVSTTERPDRTLVDLAERYPTVIGIDRDAKVLRLYENLRLKRRYKIAVGKQGLESSAGRYKIEEKIVDPPWHAPDRAWAGELAGQTIPPNDPRNPLEARWMGYHDGEGIHGTQDIDSLGTQASHGCIRMSPTAVKQLFRDVKLGTPVFLQ